MTKTPETFRIITPHAASWLWRRSDARLRRLALDSKLPHRTLKGWGRKPSRVFSFDACVERWGEPDPDRLCLLLTVTMFQVTSKGSATWELITARPHVVGDDGVLAVDMFDD